VLCFKRTAVAKSKSKLRLLLALQMSFRQVRRRDFQHAGFSVSSHLLFTTAPANHDEIVRSVNLVRFVPRRSADNLDPPIVEEDRQVSRAWRYRDASDRLSCDPAMDVLLGVIWCLKAKLVPVVH
jgi:hypothetical protein